MILGVDHIALSVSVLEDGLAAVEAERIFVQRGVVNPPEKRAILACYEPRHDLALMRPPRGPNVELTCHGPFLAGAIGPYGILQDGRISLACPDPVREAEFWIRGMSFSPGDTGHSSKLARPVPTWCCEIACIEGPDSTGTTLDSKGHACAAFLVSSLEKDLEKAVAAGAKRETAAFGLSVNGNDLSIAFFRSPCGALVEFVQMERKSH